MLSAGATYKLEVQVKLSGTAGGSLYAGQLLGTFTVAASAACLLYERAGFNTENTVLAQHPSTYQSFGMFTGSGASSQMARFRGTITPTTGGSLTTYFTNGSAIGTTTRHAGSYMEAIRIA
jgi:hypothetical protein